MKNWRKNTEIMKKRKNDGKIVEIMEKCGTPQQRPPRDMPSYPCFFNEKKKLRRELCRV